MCLTITYYHTCDHERRVRRRCRDYRLMGPGHCQMDYDESVKLPFHFLSYAKTDVLAAEIARIRVRNVAAAISTAISCLILTDPGHAEWNMAICSQR